MEYKLTEQEKARLTQQAAEMKGLTDVVVHELASKMQSRIDMCFGRRRSHASSFLQLPQQTNVRLRSSEMSFPSVSAMVEEMEARLDASESAATAQILDLRVKLLQAEND